MRFDGEFNDEVRAALCSRRNELGLGCAQMAQKLGVSWCTYRKWELGPTLRCNTKYTAKLEALLNARYDDAFMAEALHGINPESDKDVYQALTKLGLTCSLVSESPDLSRQLCSKLTCAFQRAIAAVLTTD